MIFIEKKNIQRTSLILHLKIINNYFEKKSLKNNRYFKIRSKSTLGFRIEIKYY